MATSGGNSSPSHPDDDNEHGSEEFNVDGLLKDLTKVTRRCEVMEYAYEYVKAELRQVTQMKDEMILQAQTSLQVKEDRITEQDEQLRELKVQIFDLTSKINMLNRQNEGSRMTAKSKPQEQEHVDDKMVDLKNNINRINESLVAVQVAIETEILSNQAGILQKFQDRLNKRMKKERKFIRECVQEAVTGQIKQEVVSFGATLRDEIKLAVQEAFSNKKPTHF